MTRRISLRRIAIVAGVAALAMAVAMPVYAAGIEIAVGAPEQATIGEDVEIKAVVSDEGVPVEGAEVALTYRVTFAGETDRVVLATATTDENGIAEMRYQQRANDNEEMQVMYVGPDTEAVEPYTLSIAVTDGEGEFQLYRNESGVKIPFVNGTLVILVILGVWTVIAAAAIYIARIGFAGRSARSATSAASEEGSIWIGVLLAGVTIFTAAGMVVVFARAPATIADSTDPDRYDRTPIVYLDSSSPYEGFGLNDESLAQTGDPATDGAVLYFKYGCAACHGINGQGAVVASDLVDELGSLGNFSEDVREGPRGMPGYPEGTISDENMEKIYQYLKEGG